MQNFNNSINTFFWIKKNREIMVLIREQSIRITKTALDIKLVDNLILRENVKKNFLHKWQVEEHFL